MDMKHPGPLLGLTWFKVSPEKTRSPLLTVGPQKQGVIQPPLRLKNAKEMFQAWRGPCKTRG